MWLLHSIIKYGNLAWPVIEVGFLKHHTAEFSFEDRFFWFCFPSAGLRKWYLIIRKKNTGSE